MSPYSATVTEVAQTFGTSLKRIGILRGWLNHRTALRAIDFMHGFQWLDGSFVEAKEPRDIDVVSFLRWPTGIQNKFAFQAHIAQNRPVLSRPQVKATYSVDFFMVDLSIQAEEIVNPTRYYFGLFSHRRGDDLWKGMLQVRLEDAGDDAAAIAVLDAAELALTPALPLAAPAPPAAP